MTFTNTNIRFTHTLTNALVLIGFEVVFSNKIYSEKRAWRASIPRPVT